MRSRNKLPVPFEKAVSRHQPNLRCRFKGWMREMNWHWSIMFTDRMADTMPAYGCFESIFESNRTSFGNDLNLQGPNGPDR